MNSDFIKASCGIVCMGPMAERGGTDLLSASDIKPKLEKPKMYLVVLLNDDYTPMEYVVGIVQRYFKKTRDEATAIMMQIHNKGVAKVGPFTHEIAEMKAIEIEADAKAQGHPFKTSTERAPEGP